MNSFVKGGVVEGKKGLVFFQGVCTLSGIEFPIDEVPCSRSAFVLDLFLLRAFQTHSWL